jgi:hypothetical protein
MPIYHHFYVECGSTAGWVVPPGFEPEPGGFTCHRHFGEFAWAHPGRGWLDLFWGVGALFPLRQGPPDDRRGSALLGYLDRFYDYGRNEDQLCWLPYEELFVDSWDAETVIVRGSVPARCALLFGDGSRPFPLSELLAAGTTEMELAKMRDGRLAREPLDVTFGVHRFQVSELPPGGTVEVTWQETIGGFMGEAHAGAFRRPRRHGRDGDLRILSMRG